MGMRRLVDRDAIDVGLQIGPVIQVVATQQVLIGFAFTAVQGHDQTRHRLQQLTRSISRGELHFGSDTTPSLALEAVPSSSRRSAVTVTSSSAPMLLLLAESVASESASAVPADAGGFAAMPHRTPTALNPQSSVERARPHWSATR